MAYIISGSNGVKHFGLSMFCFGYGDPTALKKIHPKF